MGWFRKAVHQHKWKVVAFDNGYHTTFTDSETERKHNLEFQKCDCGERRLVYTDSGYTLSAAQDHGGITKAKHRWIEQDRLQVTSDADVYDPDYEMVTDPNSRIRFWDYKPVTDVGLLLKKLRENTDFQTLCEHQMVEDAFGELETVIKMHENIEPPE